MPKVKTKREALSGLDESFLRDFAHEINGSRRDYSFVSNETLLERVSQKLNAEQVDMVLESYADGKSPSTSAERVAPASEGDIREAIQNFLECTGLAEVKVGARYCDFVDPDNITAIEIKTARDKIGRSEEQVRQYRLWANNVYLAYDAAHEGNIPSSLIDLGIGQMRYESGVIEEVCPPSPNEVTSKERLCWMTYDELSSVARSHDIRPEGRKEAIATNLVGSLSQDDVSTAFSNYLRSRA